MVGEATSTKERILDAAQTLFGTYGLEGTSLRAVTNAADVNLAAVNYHFGSKEELFQAVIRRVMEPIIEEHGRRIEELKSPFVVEDVLDAFIMPFLRLIANQHDRSLARFVARILSDADEATRCWPIEQSDATDARYLEAFSQALPHLSHDELVWRFQAILGTIIFLLVGAPVMNLAVESPSLHTSAEDVDVMRTRAVAFLVAGLQAKATTPLH